MLPAILHSLDWGHSTHVNCKIIQDDAVLLDKQSSWVQKAHRVDNEYLYEKYSLCLKQLHLDLKLTPRASTQKTEFQSLKGSKTASFSKPNSRLSCISSFYVAF